MDHREDLFSGARLRLEKRACAQPPRRIGRENDGGDGNDVRHERHALGGVPPAMVLLARERSWREGRAIPDANAVHHDGSCLAPTSSSVSTLAQASTVATTRVANVTLVRTCTGGKRTLTLAVTGRLDFAAAAAFWAASNPGSPACDTYLVDLSEVTEILPSGFALLLMLARRARDRGATLGLLHARAQGNVQRTLERVLDSMRKR